MVCDVWLQNEARKANQMAMVAEKKRLEAPSETRGISKQKWFEDRQKKIGKLLDANGLDMKKAYMLDTQEMAESKYKKWEKDPAPFGWDGKLLLSLSLKESLYRYIICILSPLKFLFSSHATIYSCDSQMQQPSHAVCVPPFRYTGAFTNPQAYQILLNMDLLLHYC